jgi:hypothetical protein
MVMGFWTIAARPAIGFTPALTAMVALSTPAVVRGHNKVAFLEWASTPRAAHDD